MANKFTLFPPGWRPEDDLAAGAEQAREASLPPITSPYQEPTPGALPVETPDQRVARAYRPIAVGMKEMLGPEITDHVPPTLEPPYQAPEPTVKGALKEYLMNMIPGYRRMRQAHDITEAQAITARNANQIRMYSEALDEVGRQRTDRRTIAASVSGLALREMMGLMHEDDVSRAQQINFARLQEQRRRNEALENKKLTDLNGMAGWISTTMDPLIDGDNKRWPTPEEKQREKTRVRMMALGPSGAKAFFGSTPQEIYEGINAIHKEYFPEDDITFENFKQWGHMNAPVSQQTSGLTPALATEDENEPAQLGVLDKRTGRWNPATGPGGGPLTKGKTPEKMPAQTKSKVDQAYVIADMIGKVRADLNDPELVAQLGPIRGRLSELALKYGDFPPNLTQVAPKVARLYTSLKSLSAMQPALHGFRGMNSQQHFEQAIGLLQKDPALLLGHLDGIQDTVDTFIDMGNKMGYSPVKQAKGGEKTAAPSLKVGDIVEYPKGSGKKIRILALKGNQITDYEEVK